MSKTRRYSNGITKRLTFVDYGDTAVRASESTISNFRSLQDIYSEHCNRYRIVASVLQPNDELFHLY